MPSTYVESVEPNTHIARLLRLLNFGISEKEQAILKHLATKGPAWYYELSEKQKIASNKTVLKSLANLQKKEMIKVEKAESCEFMGRKRKSYSLTFKGLVVTIQKGLIEPSKAWDIKRKYGIEISCNRSCETYENTTPECSYVKNFMEQQPEIFFKILSRLPLPNIIDVPQDVLSNCTCLATMLGGFYLFLTDPEFHKQSCQHDLKFGCHSIPDPGPPENTERSIMSIVKPFLMMLGFDIPKTPPCNIEED